MVEVSASVLNVDNEKAIKTLYELETAKVDYFHIDVMDGKFVKNKKKKKMLEYSRSRFFYLYRGFLCFVSYL